MRRETTARCVAVLAVVAGTAWATPALARRGAYSLRAGRVPGAVDLVEVALEVGGDLKVVEAGKVQRTKMSVAASFVYDEKSLRAPDSAAGSLRSIRHYRKAAGVIN